MPTFTTIALENLLEPRVRDSYKSFKTVEVRDRSKVRSDNHVYVSPAMYVTPEPTPIPEVSAGPLSPSPYVVNHKRRANLRADLVQVPVEHAGGVEKEEEKLEEVIEVNGDGIGGGGEEVLDPNFNVSNQARVIDFRSMMSFQGEFFDASEDFFSEGSSGSPYSASMASELQNLRFKLIEETEKRKAAEDALNLMRSRWLKIRDVLSQEGLTLPSPSDVISGTELVQELDVARFVAQAIGKGQARAEAELASEAILETKNQEISRLKDRLQYYEAVNLEMSQRNQEIIDAARKQRQRKRTQQKWLWSFVGFSAVVGVSVAAYMFLPQTSSHQPTSSSTDSTS